MNMTAGKWSGIAVFIIAVSLVCVVSIDFESSQFRIVPVWQSSSTTSSDLIDNHSDNLVEQALQPAAQGGSSGSLIPALTFLTLSFGNSDSYANKVVTHNCLKFQQLRSTYPTTFRHTFKVYTTDPSSKPYCTACECVEYKYYNCPCIEEGTRKKPCKRRNACEKLYWITDMLLEYKQFAVLDHDLIILKDSFPNALALRSLSNDFVATRAHSHLRKNNSDYFRFFNSGLFFIRALPNHRPYVLREWFYGQEEKTNRDQRIFSQYVHKLYDNWDELSYKWNCRYLDLQNIPVQDCYTMHEGEQRVYPLLDSINFQFLTLPSSQNGSVSTSSRALA